MLQKQLKLIYLNNDEHTHMDILKGTTGLSPNLAKKNDI